MAYIEVYAPIKEYFVNLEDEYIRIPLTKLSVDQDTYSPFAPEKEKVTGKANDFICLHALEERIVHELTESFDEIMAYAGDKETEVELQFENTDELLCHLNSTAFLRVSNEGVRKIGYTITYHMSNPLGDIVYDAEYNINEKKATWIEGIIGEEISKDYWNVVESLLENFSQNEDL